MASSKSSANSELQLPTPTISHLSTLLDSLHKTLEPLFGIPLSELTTQLEHGSSKEKEDPTKVTAKNSAENNTEEYAKEKNPNKKSKDEKQKGTQAELAGKLDIAKLYASVAYVLLDLVWIYLKVKGIEPSTHPVLAELSRTKDYFGKIKAVEKQEENDRRSRVDQSAAGRFIRHALASASTAQATHKRFDESGENEKDEKLASSDIQTAMKEIEEDVSKKDNPSRQSGPKSKGKRRPTLDPFEGYDKPSPATATKRMREDGGSTEENGVDGNLPFTGAQTSKKTSKSRKQGSKEAKKKSKAK